MPKFKIKIAVGASASSGDTQTFHGLTDSFVIEAQDRVDAYIKAYRQLQQQGDVTVIEHVEGQKFPLGFTSDEVERISAANVPVKPGYPSSGVQIEQIMIDQDLSI